jgi:hypothetical protein
MEESNILLCKQCEYRLVDLCESRGCFMTNNFERDWEIFCSEDNNHICNTCRVVEEIKNEDFETFKISMRKHLLLIQEKLDEK